MKKESFLESYISDYPDAAAFEANRKLIQEVEEHFRLHAQDPEARRMLANVRSYRRFIATALQAFNMDCDYLFEAAFKVAYDNFEHFAKTGLSDDVCLLPPVSEELKKKGKALFLKDYCGPFRYIYEHGSPGQYKRYKEYVNEFQQLSLID
jgi:hypothetical protein